MTQVIIPFAGDCPHRRANLNFMLARYDDYEVTVAEGDADNWSKGAVVHSALDDSAEVIVIADADCVVRHADFRWAISHARKHGWASPHTKVYRLDDVTSQSFRMSNKLPYPLVLQRKPTVAVPGGGIVAIRRDAYDAVGGMDPRFVGWGGEDAALSLMLGRLVYPFDMGDRERPLWHLFHPPAPLWRQPSLESRQLARRYRRMARTGQLPVMAQEVRDAHLC